MAKKSYYYVLVFSDNGPVYVTSIDNTTRYAHWDKNEKPMVMSQVYAEDLAMGLNLNFNSCVVVKSPHEISGHPYNYEEFDCTFVRKENKDEQNNSDDNTTKWD